MRIQTILLQCMAVCLSGVFSVGAFAAVAPGAEMPSRVTLSGVPEERVTLRSISAPVTSIAIAPSAKQLEIAAQSGKYAQPKEAGLAAILGIKSPAVRGSSPLRIASVFPSGAEARVVNWEAVGGGYVTQFRITSVGAAGIRAKLLLPPGLTQGEIRVVSGIGISGIGDRAEVVPFRAALNREIWTPYTEGERQIAELLLRNAAPVGVPRVPRAADRVLRVRRPLDGRREPAGVA